MQPFISGEERETTRSVAVEGLSGSICEVAWTPRIRVHEAIETARQNGFNDLQQIPVRELLDRIAVAGQAFLGVGAPASTIDLPPFERYQRQVVASTGLPAGWVRTSAHWLAFGLRHTAESLRAQSPTGELAVYDNPAYVRETDVRLAFTPRVRVLGGTMPANDPTVYAWPILALAMKIPIVLRPSDRDPFTAIRLGRALRAAGIPKSAVHILPGDRSIGETICRKSDHALAFGGEDVVGQFYNDPTVETYGPGKSVAVVSREPTDWELKTLARGVTRAGGRACFCLTRIVATGDCDADAMAERLVELVVNADSTRCGSLYDERTGVPGFPLERAIQIDDAVSDQSGTDVTADYRTESRLVEYDGIGRLLPTILRTDELVSELPFQFAGVTHCAASELTTRLKDTYLGVVIGDTDLEQRFVRSPEIRKVYGGRYPATVDLRETHETYLTSFLYETTTHNPSFN